MSHASRARTSGVLSVVLLVALTAGLPIGRARAGHAGCRGCGQADCGVEGVCIPNRLTFGYYETDWRRWPLETRPRSAADGPPIDLQAVPEVELPDPRQEAGNGSQPSGGFSATIEPISETPPAPPADLDLSSPDAAGPTEAPPPDASHRGWNEFFPHLADGPPRPDTWENVQPPLRSGLLLDQAPVRLATPTRHRPLPSSIATAVLPSTPTASQPSREIDRPGPAIAAAETLTDGQRLAGRQRGDGFIPNPSNPLRGTRQATSPTPPTATDNAVVQASYAPPSGSTQPAAADANPLRHSARVGLSGTPSETVQVPHTPKAGNDAAPPGERVSTQRSPSNNPLRP